MKSIKILFMVILILSINSGCSKKREITNNNLSKKKLEINIDTAFQNKESDSLNYNKYKHGKKVGFWKEFYKNGKIKNEGIFSEGKKQGLHKEWQSNGLLISAGDYKNGIANGLMKWYHEKGFLAGEGFMKNGLRHGIWKVYAVEDGKLTTEVKFNEGKQQEVIKTYQ